MRVVRRTTSSRVALPRASHSRSGTGPTGTAARTLAVRQTTSSRVAPRPGSRSRFVTEHTGTAAHMPAVRPTRSLATDRASLFFATTRRRGPVPRSGDRRPTALPVSECAPGRQFLAHIDVQHRGNRAALADAVSYLSSQRLMPTGSHRLPDRPLMSRETTRRRECMSICSRSELRGVFVRLTAVILFFGVGAIGFLVE